MLASFSGPYVDFDRRAWYGTDAQYLQRRAGGRLFALFYGTPLSGSYGATVNRHLGYEARLMRRAVLGEDPIGRAQPIGLERLL